MTTGEPRRVPARPPASSPEQEITAIAARHPSARETIIFAPGMPWDATMFQRPQQLARALARCGALVFYMQPEAAAPLQAKFTELETRLFLCSAPAPAFRDLPAAYVYVLTWNIPRLAYFESPRVIYDYLDDISAFHGDRRRMERDHADYLSKADLVLATSHRLYRQAAALRTDCLLCPNGVDAAHFTLTAPPPPADLLPVLSRRRPIIGYHGALARWVDYTLLRILAQKRPEYEFVLVGTDHDQTLSSSGLLEMPNITWLGPKPYADLPAYVGHFDVGLIPFQVNEITHATSPIKLFEYYAAGKPVIIPPLDEAGRLPEALVAASPAEWLERLEQGLEMAGRPEVRERLRSIGEQNSWEARAASILDRLATVSQVRPRQPWFVRWQARNPLLRLVGQTVKVWRMSGPRGVLKSIYYKIGERFKWLERLPGLRVPRFLDDTYIPEDNSQVTVYTDDPALFPNYWPRRGLAQAQGKPRAAVSLISTTYNEMEHLAGWLESVLAQTCPPDEIVVTDGGSTDGTFEYLAGFAEKSPISLRLFRERGANISRGRNIAIRNARNEIIASSDCGCRLHPTWLENLTAPFQAEPRTQVVAGWYRPIDRRGRDLPHWDWPALSQLDPQTFIPSSRSLAFTREAWKMVGGYPEWLTRTGEDTYFALELKRFCSRWAFAPSAVVDWYGPGAGLVILKAHSWAIGDGETGYKAWEYRRKARRILLGSLAFAFLVLLPGFALTGLLGIPPMSAWGGSLLAAVLLFLAGAALINRVPLYRPLSMLAIRLAQVIGFWTGARRKVQAEQRRLAKTKGVFFILAGVPIDDTGGGARCAQIAQELLRQNYWVVYVNRYPKYESKETGIRIVHPNLHTFEAGKFNWEAFQGRHEGLLAGLPKFALVDFPSADFLPLIQKIHAAGGTVLYEMVDDWNTPLGGDWYSPAVEEQIIRSSDGLVATAPVLQDKLQALSGRTALLLPNAVNSRLFDPQRAYPVPPDLPQAEWTAIYVGALWGDWFDWDLLAAAARRYPQAAVVVVGDYRGQCSDAPPNLHFLGLKPQAALPAYLAHADVALIPWKVNEITQATSPLKLYEYLAMRRPVVAPLLRPLAGIPGVHLAGSREEYLALIERARREPFPAAQVDEFVRANNWQERLSRLLEFALQASAGGAH